MPAPTRYTIKSRGSYYANKSAARRAYAQRGSSARRTYIPRSILQKDTGELHTVDVALDQPTTIVSTTGTNANAVCLNGVARGDGSYERLGRKIFMKSIRLKGMLNYLQTNITGTNDIEHSALRMVVIVDKHHQDGDGTPNFDDIFNSINAAGTKTSYIWSERNPENMERFQVLLDKSFEAPNIIPEAAATTDDYVSTDIPFDFYIKMKNMTSLYSGASSSIANITSNAVFVFWRASGGTSTIDSWTVPAQSSSRLRFTC